MSTNRHRWIKDPKQLSSFQTIWRCCKCGAEKRQYLRPRVGRRAAKSIEYLSKFPGSDFINRSRRPYPCTGKEPA